MKSIAFISLLILSCGHTVISQSKYGFAQFGDETIDVIRQPLTWEETDWLQLGLVGAGTFAVMQIDQPFRDVSMQDRNHSASFPITLGKFWGGAYPTVVLAGAFGLHGFLADDNSTKKLGFEIVQAALYSGGVTTALKVVFGRARPYTDRGRADFRPFTFFDDGFHALPSGHTTWAFALSTVLSRNVDSKAWKVLAYVPAALTVISRVYDDQHWASDCALGAVIGYVTATWVVNLHDRKESRVQVSCIYPLTIRINLN